jgi:hypothetical protein
MRRYGDAAHLAGLPLVRRCLTRGGRPRCAGPCRVRARGRRRWGIGRARARGRLSEDPARRVLLLEAGPDEGGRAAARRSPTPQSTPGGSGRDCRRRSQTGSAREAYLRGRGVGGSSAHQRDARPAGRPRRLRRVGARLRVRRVGLALRPQLRTDGARADPRRPQRVV